MPAGRQPYGSHRGTLLNSVRLGIVLVTATESPLMFMNLASQWDAEAPATMVRVYVSPFDAVNALSEPFLNHGIMHARCHQ